jgi:inner membrane protein
MDPLTHTLVGASLAETRVGRVGLGTATCVIGANLPDIDAATYFLGGDLALGFRRGWTHGVLAMAVLPLVLTVPARARPGGGAVGAGRRHGRGHCCS